MKRRECRAYGCAERRQHFEADEPRGPQFVDVPDDYPDDRPAYCSMTCALLAGDASLASDTEKLAIVVKTFEAMTPSERHATLGYLKSRYEASGNARNPKDDLEMIRSLIQQLVSAPPYDCDAVDKAWDAIHAWMKHP